MITEKGTPKPEDSLGGIVFDLIAELLTNLIGTPLIIGVVVLVISLIWPDLAGVAVGVGISFVAGSLILGSGGKVLSAVIRLVVLLLRRAFQ